MQIISFATRETEWNDEVSRPRLWIRKAARGHGGQHLEGGNVRPHSNKRITCIDVDAVAVRNQPCFQRLFRLGKPDVLRPDTIEERGAGRSCVCNGLLFSDGRRLVHEVEPRIERHAQTRTKLPDDVLAPVEVVRHPPCGPGLRAGGELLRLGQVHHLGA